MSKAETKNLPPAWGPLRYQSDCPMPLAIRPDASVSEVSNHLSARLRMLEAMLTLTYGEAPALELCDGEADSYLWACGLLASECRALHSELSRVASFKTEGGVS
ncbi:hypothetical protein MASR1M60_26500 [Rhodocyclaceae bacterium]